MYANRILSIVLAITASIAGAPQSSARAERADDFSSKVITEFRTHFTALSLSRGLPLEVHVNPLALGTSARADVDEDGASITVDQGLLNSPRLTADGLRIILCHELGHILGGAPRKNVPMEWDGLIADDGLSVVSSEGQADYYATLVCFRKLVAGQAHHIEKVSAKKDCDLSHGANTEASKICQRAVLGSENFLLLAQDFPIAINKPDASRAPALIRDMYPDRQCRLDTFVAGALCSTQTTEFSLDFNNSAANECAQSQARRPACWYQ